jgi:hypothetical protein
MSTWKLTSLNFNTDTQLWEAQGQVQVFAEAGLGVSTWIDGPKGQGKTQEIATEQAKHAVRQGLQALLQALGGPSPAVTSS